MSIPRAAAVVVDAGKVLIIKRYLRQNHADACVMCKAGDATGQDCEGHHYAVIPGGHIEPGETPDEAALRELAAAHSKNNSDELVWTALPDLDALGIYPSDVQPNLSQLIAGE
ncbi:NUDIX domain-containing protein [Kribbella solani]|uniref:NUDIX domain-containing protein n=1 Tax=Kribbella solani TaxID=236067 RepID=UPI0029BE8F5B|nr:NUDIX domain-containing protein [Kribbella solani]MDX2973535.1 NUDIX domain-containing protein [Kribbella solani]